MKFKDLLIKQTLKGAFFAFGMLSTGLLAVSVSGVIHSFNPGDPISAATMNENFQSLKSAIEKVPVFNLDYSLDETDTGIKWVDGKSIFRRYIDIGTLPSSGVKVIPHGLNGAYNVIKYYGMTKHFNNTFRKLDLAGADQIFVQISPREIYIHTFGTYSAFSDTWLIIEYTK